MSCVASLTEFRLSRSESRRLRADAGTRTLLATETLLTYVFESKEIEVGDVVDVGAVTLTDEHGTIPDHLRHRDAADLTSIDEHQHEAQIHMYLHHVDVTAAGTHPDLPVARCDALRPLCGAVVVLRHLREVMREETMTRIAAMDEEESARRLRDVAHLCHAAVLEETVSLRVPHRRHRGLRSGTVAEISRDQGRGLVVAVIVKKDHHHHVDVPLLR